MTLLCIRIYKAVQGQYDVKLTIYFQLIKMAMHVLVNCYKTFLYDPWQEPAGFFLNSHKHLLLS